MDTRALLALDPDQLTPEQAAAIVAAASEPAPCLRVDSTTTVDTPVCFMIKGGSKKTNQTTNNTTTTTVDASTTDRRVLTEGGSFASEGATQLGSGAIFAAEGSTLNLTLAGGGESGRGDRLGSIPSLAAIQDGAPRASAAGGLPPWLPYAAAAAVVALLLIVRRR